MKGKLNKMLVYLDLLDQSEHKIFSIKNSKYYKVFGKYNEQEIDLERQQKVSDKIIARIENLKKEL